MDGQTDRRTDVRTDTQTDAGPRNDQKSSLRLKKKLNKYELV